MKTSSNISWAGVRTFARTAWVKRFQHAQDVLPLPSTGRGIEGEGWCHPERQQGPKLSCIPTPHPGPLPVEGRGRQLASLCSIGFMALFVTWNLSAANWPAWRGDGSGVSTEKHAPVTWSKSENVRWRTALPDRGNSSPIVWEDKVFLTQAEGTRRSVMAFERNGGKLLWQQGTDYTEKDPSHETNPHASATPVTDGERVIATFGSAGVHAFDLEGKKLWSRDLGKQTHIWGYGSSPVIHQDLCLLYFGPGPRSFLTALDKKSGKTVWQVDAPEWQPAERFDGFAGKSNGVVGTWSTPLIVKSGTRDEVVMTFANQMRGFDPKSGRELWKTDGLNPLLYTSPIAGEGFIVGMGGFFGSTVAVKMDGSGDLSAQKVWSVKREKKHYLSSGVIKDKHIYISATVGVAECRELATGKLLWEERLKTTGPKGETWGSMIGVGDKLYVVNQSGDTFVLRANPEKFEQLAVNSLNEPCNTTPAISNGELFIRTDKALWCISERGTERASVH
jgi:outer membrane protein assembly factor BamB